MRNIFRKVLKVLDKPPRGAKGQSLVEMAFTAPLLFLMIVSTAEIGFLANNYLILLDAVREGGRHAVTLSPLNWNERLWTRNWQRTDCDTRTATYNLKGNFQVPPDNGSPHHPLQPTYFNDDTGEGDLGFFDGTACQVIASMDPLKFNVATDDVVVSAIGFTNRCNDVAANCYDANRNPTGTRRLTVTSRWPVLNRYCPPEDSRDPFNFDGTLVLGQHPDLQPLNTDIRGFIMTGNQLTDGGCVGSKFHIGGGDYFDLEAKFNTLNVDNLAQSNAIRNNVPSGGMVIVEMTWVHKQLFNFPPLSLIGDGKLYIWMMFPVSSAEPTATP